jgi:hypothetical protein
LALRSIEICRDVAAGPRQTVDQFPLDRIRHENEDDRYGRGGPLRRQCGKWGHRDQDINLECDEFGGQTCKPIGLLIWEAMLQRDRPASDVAEIGEPFLKRAQINRLLLGISRVPENAYARNPSALLRMRAE